MCWVVDSVEVRIDLDSEQDGLRASYQHQMRSVSCQQVGTLALVMLALRGEPQLPQRWLELYQCSLHHQFSATLPC